MNWQDEQKIFDLRNEINKEYKVPINYTDFDRQVVIEENGVEKIVPVKQIVFECKPNTNQNLADVIIKKYSERLGWKFVCHNKIAWVNGYIKHDINFKL